MWACCNWKYNFCEKKISFETWKKEKTLSVVNNSFLSHVQSKLIVIIVIKIVEWVCVFVMSFANIVFVMSVFITVDFTTILLLLILFWNNVTAFKKVAIKIRKKIFVVVFVKSLNNECWYSLFNDSVYSMCNNFINLLYNNFVSSLYDDSRNIVKLKNNFVS